MPESAVFRSGSAKPRLAAVDVAAGIVIGLVVLGHIQFLGIGGVAWYGKMRNFIYQFHMQIFFFLAGFLFFFTKDVDDKDYRHWRFWLSRFRKFMIPFVFFALFFYAMEWVLAADKVSFLARWREDLFLQVFVPYQAYPGFLWFVYVLLTLYATVPPVARLVPRGKRFLLLVPAVALQLTVSTLWFSLNFYAKHLPFFICGMLYCYHKDRIDRMIRAWGWGCWLVMAVWGWFAIRDGWVPPVMLSIVAVPVVLQVSEWLSGNRLLQEMGRNSFAIYLQNMTIIGAMYIVLSRGLGMAPQGMQFLIPVFVVVGVGIPLVLGRLIPKNWRLIRDVLGYP